MSRLKLFRPSERSGKLRIADDDTQPVVFSFLSERRRFDQQRADSVVSRARSLFQNRLCPRCHHSIVEPLELDDGVRNRNQLPIPGTATLVGYHCHGCHSEWPA